QPTKFRRIEVEKSFNINSLERDLGLWKQIAYIKVGPYQYIISKYPKSREKHQQSFQSSWFKLFPSWLEYSLSKDATFCLPCYLFHTPNVLLDLMHSLPMDFEIGKKFEHFTSQQVLENRLQLKASIDAIRWLAFQDCAFRGHDESKASQRVGNFRELLIEALNKAPQNALYTYLRIQKEILQVLSVKIKKTIHEEIGDAKFCIIIDETRDEFVNKNGYVKERFFGLVHDEILFVLSQHNLDIQSIRGQGYDSAIGVLCKRTDKLKVAHAENIAHLLAIDELQSGKRLNHIGTLQRPANMRRSSHLKSVSSMMNMFGVICELQSQDILNAMHLDDLITKVISFCKLVNIYVPNLNALYVTRRGRARHQQDEITIEHHYRIDIFNAVINSQLQELNNKFNNHIVELLSFSSVLDPKEMRASFKTDDICKMVEKIYPQGFVEYEMVQLRFEIYSLVYRATTLIFTLPVSTVTTERSFSIKDELLFDCLLLYIKKEIAK
ncbi:hypothetical protein MANES_03G069164v8, partial [Manihot esculenta]